MESRIALRTRLQEIINSCRIQPGLQIDSMSQRSDIGGQWMGH